MGVFSVGMFQSCQFSGIKVLGMMPVMEMESSISCVKSAPH